MAKKYKDSEGMYLALDETSQGWSLGWYSNDDECVTCPVVDILHHAKSDEPPAEKSDWESWIVARVSLAHGCDSLGLFKDKKSTKIAMQAANEALLRGDVKPEPAWVQHARNAGWTPPVGWKV